MLMLQKLLEKRCNLAGAWFFNILSRFVAENGVLWCGNVQSISRIFGVLSNYHTSLVVKLGFRTLVAQKWWFLAIFDDFSILEASLAALAWLVAPISAFILIAGVFWAFHQNTSPTSDHLLWAKSSYKAENPWKIKKVKNWKKNFFC